MRWTEELKAEAKALWATTSATDIAKLLAEKYSLAITRNSVVGLMHRMGMTSAAKTKAHKKDNYSPERVRKQRSGTRKPRLHIVANGGGGYRVTETVQGEMPEFTCAPVEPLNKTLAELGPEDCRFIKGDPIADGPGIYCGHPVAAERSFCPVHCRIVYQPAQPPKVKTRPSWRRAA